MARKAGLQRLIKLMKILKQDSKMDNALHVQDNSSSISLSSQERLEKRITKRSLRDAYASPLKGSFLWKKYLIAKPMSDIVQANGLEHSIRYKFIPLIGKVEKANVMKCELRIIDEGEFTKLKFYVKDLSGNILAEDAGSVRNVPFNNFDFYACRIVMTEEVEKTIYRDGTANEKEEKEIEHVVLNIYDLDED